MDIHVVVREIIYEISNGHHILVADKVKTVHTSVLGLSSTLWIRNKIKMMRQDGTTTYFSDSVRGKN